VNTDKFCNQYEQENKLMSNMYKLRTGLLGILCSALIFGSAVARADGIQVIADNELPEVIASTKGKLVIHFSSFDNRCGPCVKSNPHVDDLAKEFAGKVTFRRVATMDWTKNSPEMTKLNVMALPSVFLFQDGKVVYKYLGDPPKGYAPLRAKLAE
jgi:thioredoxin 1